MIHRLALIANKRFVAPSPYDPVHPVTLAVWCSDGRFTKAVEDLLRGDGRARFDTLTLPGGPALFTGRSASPSDLDTMTTSAEFLISAHKVEHIVLIAHENCGYYRRLLGPAATDATIRARQEEDIRRATAELRRLRPALQIEGRYAGVVSGKVVFDPLKV